MAEKLTFGRLKSFILEKQRSLKEEISAQTYIADTKGTEEGIDSRLVAFTDPTSHVAEQYRSLRTNLCSLSPDNPLQAILVTSSLRSEGKTISACNLSFSLAQDREKRVILVDGDMRKASIHKLFNISKEPGFSDVLSRGYSIDRFIDKPICGNLYVVPAGKAPANPSELLTSSRMKSLLADLRSKFDWIIFDIPPIIAVTDASVLGAQLDGTLLVVRAGRTQAVDVERAYSLLKEAHARPVGAILTNVVTYIPYYLYRYRYIYAHYARPYSYT